MVVDTEIVLVQVVADKVIAGSLDKEVVGSWGTAGSDTGMD